MAHQGNEDAYVTLLTNDTYLPGALVLAHSLRDAGTSKKLAVLVTLDSVATEVVAQLKDVFDYVLPVPRIKNEAAPDNLRLMKRPDLHSAFTKINLWTLRQFRKIVYIDADVVALRAPDELFDLEHAFAAAPDIGWPDLFNTGVMVLTPNLGEYEALSAKVKDGDSFDGADQGLLNIHFKDAFHRLPFTYNVTPSAHYQYLPAYRHFQSSISMAHFIGTEKPWLQGRSASHGGGAYDELVGQWWAVYDRHYRAVQPGSSTPAPPAIVQYFVKGEYNPTVSYKLTATSDLGSLTYDQGPWDAQRQSPPANAKPEALNFPQAHYEMSRDTTPFVAPQHYPSPPGNLGYGAPNAAPASTHIFPWEANQPVPTRVFVEPSQPAPVSEPAPTASLPVAQKTEPTTPTTPSASQELPPSDPWAGFARSNAWDGVPQIERYVDAYQRKHSRVRSRGNVPGTLGLAGVGDKADSGGSRVTDFPSEVERPSLPVTPAPIRRSTHWGAEDENVAVDARGERLLPAAQGVPQQVDWDPASQLQKLAQEQSKLLLNKLGQETPKATTAIPSRPLAGSEAPVVSPIPVKPGGLETSSVRSIYDQSSTASSVIDTAASDSTGRLTPDDTSIAEPAYHGPGLVFEKGEDVPAHGMTAALPSENELDVLET